MKNGQCPKCGNNFYDFSDHCMTCGWKPMDKQKIITISVVSIFLISLFVLTTTDVFTTREEIEKREVAKKEKEAAQKKENADNNMLYMARQAVLARMKDPGSSEFSDVYRAASGAVCGRVNAKNSFGAYTGFVRFVSGGTQSATFLESDPAAAKNFNEVWDRMCKVALP
ncbi:hypothetical protein [Desulfobulbus oligotrophicus]|uniref:Uncharacterized protein n=1 Tax=Desulfobulbus oligotrophicus TaxID=1909699 RepID=A0A7T5VE92_9BACT|nr:hypothetical protein [Desulfobulbus oligotrophicus]QQG66330.1 hypothetical protein HP555_10865 [Desulfobulbus oligotrophicus]